MTCKALLLLVASVVPAFPWGCQGHQVIALTAWQLMSDQAKSMTGKLDSAFPPDPNLAHFCKGDEALARIAQIATWADDFRSVDPTTANWHFLDVPIGASVGDGTGFCADGCITKALSEQYAKLQNAPQDITTDNSAALRFVIHFVGDMHQPLHLANNNDRGGNCVPVQFLTKKPKLSGSKYSPELHGVWDDNLVQSAMDDLQAADVNAFALQLAAKAKQNQDAWSAGAPPQWMADTHAIAEKTGYGELTASPSIPDLVHAIAGPDGLQKCSDNHFDKSLAAKHLKINQTYVNDANPGVEEQLAKAGLRLANMLNALWP